MPVYMDDPSVLSTERLKSELRAHTVELSGGNMTLDAFSSDEELPPPVEQSRRSRSSGRKSTVVPERPDLALLSDEDLRDQLLKHGVHAGPIVVSTRKLYEKKLLKLLDNGAIVLESQSHSNRGEAEVYSDQEEEVPAAPEPDPPADAELEPPSTQRCSSSHRHIVTTVEQVENMTEELPPSEEDTALPDLNTFTGLTATCRLPIKGAAGRPVVPDLTHSFESQSSVCVSAPIATYSTPFTTNHTPSAASSACCSASSTPSTACQAKERAMCWWKKLLLLVVLVVFAFLVFQAMESNTAAPVEQAEEL